MLTHYHGAAPKKKIKYLGSRLLEILHSVQLHRTKGPLLHSSRLSSSKYHKARSRESPDVKAAQSRSNLRTRECEMLCIRGLFFFCLRQNSLSKPCSAKLFSLLYSRQFYIYVTRVLVSATVLLCFVELHRASSEWCAHRCGACEYKKQRRNDSKRARFIISWWKLNEHRVHANLPRALASLQGNRTRDNQASFGRPRSCDAVRMTCGV